MEGRAAAWSRVIERNGGRGAGPHGMASAGRQVAKHSGGRVRRRRGAGLQGVAAAGRGDIGHNDDEAQRR